MTVDLGIVKIPASFESLRDAVGSTNLSNVLLECPDDLLAIKQAIAEVTSAGQGKLMFLFGKPGQGKTTVIESTSVFLADVVGSVLTPPAEYALPLSDLPTWLHKELPTVRKMARDKFVIVNLDGREIPTTNELQTQAAMGNLNALLRKQPNLLLVWPVNDRTFAEAAIARLTVAGGKSALVTAPIYNFKGVPKDRYMQVLDLILAATNVSLADAATSRQEAEDQISNTDRVGDFLREIQKIVVSKYDLGEIGAILPRLYIIFTANDDIYSDCRLLRRGSRFLVDPDKLLQFSRANVAEDWKRRGKENPRKGLQFISAIFETKLLNVSSSAVVNACAFGNDADLKVIVKKHYNAKVSTNAANALANSALARALRGDEDVGLAKSNPSEPIKNAYREIQDNTNAKHRPINESIVKVINQLNIQTPGLEFEYRPFGDDKTKELRVDVWCKRGDRPEALEFTHRADGEASTAVIASYVLGKIQDYARDYGLL